MGVLEHRPCLDVKRLSRTLPNTARQAGRDYGTSGGRVRGVLVIVKTCHEEQYSVGVDAERDCTFVCCVRKIDILHVLPSASLEERLRQVAVGRHEDDSGVLERVERRTVLRVIDGQGDERNLVASLKTERVDYLLIRERRGGCGRNARNSEHGVTCNIAAHCVRHDGKRAFGDDVRTNLGACVILASEVRLDGLHDINGVALLD